MPHPFETDPLDAGGRREEAPSRALSRSVASILIIVGLLVLGGWAFDIETFKRLLPGLVAMNPATALAFIASGASLWCWSSNRAGLQNAARILSLIPLVFGSLKLFGLLTGMDPGIDHWLFASQLQDSATGFANRMAPNTALNFLLTGLALWLLPYHTRSGSYPSQYLGLGAAMASLLAVFGYAYGTKSLYGVGSYIPMALHTALCFLLLVAGILAYKPSKGWMATLTNPGAGGVLVRRLLPAVILLPFLLGWFRLIGERAELYDNALGLSLTVLANTVLVGAIVWWTATLLWHADERRLAAEAERERVNQALVVAHAELQRKNSHMETDLALAREIQQAFLPQQFISFPHPGSAISGSLQFHHRYQPAAELGGDFADILLISESQAGILVCDVMGHGVRSALVTAVVRGLAEELMTVAGDPGRFLTGLNRGLLAVLQRTKTPMFITAFYIVTDVTINEMRYASAGHPCPLRRRDAEGGELPEVEYLDLNGQPPGPALGVFPEATYDTYTSELCSGDLVMLFTDGLVEIENDAGEVFDEARLQAAVHERGALGAAELLEELLAEARQVSGHAAFEDDICLVGIEVTGDRAENFTRNKIPLVEVKVGAAR